MWLNCVRIKIAQNTSVVLYHVTSADRLGSIASEGLVPDMSSSIGGKSYDSHRIGRIFLSSPNGISFWFDKSQRFIENGYEDWQDLGMAPVILRVHVDSGRLERDELGSQDSYSDSFFYNGVIPPENIELWDGQGWMPILDLGDIPIDEAFDEEGYILPQNKSPFGQPEIESG